MTIYIVTDLGYGDSGKGTTVDFLARDGDSVVVRHNGGPQAGHNVMTPEGMHHEFSQFGSGTFAGAQTYLSKYMLINPLDMIREARHLKEDCKQHDLMERTFVDAEARIITPWHIALNRLLEMARGDDRHGSCGKGIGTAMQQDIDMPDLTIRVKDIRRPNFGWKLSALREYLEHIAPWDFVDGQPEMHVLRDYKLFADLADQYHRWYNLINIVEDANWLPSAALNKNIIFEGAQGVLLDEWYGFHPYTTWSTTTHENALRLLSEADYDGPVTRLGVTRAYMIRHGAGPFVSEDESVHFDEPHNFHGPWQGGFRQGHLDLVMLQYALDACDGVDGLVVTHLDRADEWQVAERHFYSLMSWEVEKIHFRALHDLSYQQILTDTLLTAQPVYGGSLNQEELLDCLSHYAPVHITSHGPTHADKQWARKESLV